MLKKKAYRHKVPQAIEIQRALHEAEYKDKMTRCIILQGDALRGYIPIGTFDDEEEAKEYAKNLHDTFIISELIHPDDE